MRQFAIIGLSNFGKRMLEELLSIDAEVLIVDKDKELIEQYKEKATAAYIADVINEETIKKIIPSTIDAAIIDLGDRVEVSILVTNYLKKHGIKNIIAKAETDEHGEILEIVGATQVIFPNREAAKRITPLLVSSYLFNYLPISNGLVIAEVKVPQKYYEMTLVEANLRHDFGVNVIAIRKEPNADYDFFTPEYRMQDDDVLLLVGKERDISFFSGAVLPERKKRIGSIFKTFFRR